MSRLRFTYKAPRWANIDSFVKQLALYCNVTCNVEFSKGWFTTSGTVVCYGEDKNVAEFQHEFESAISKYNEK